MDTVPLAGQLTLFDVEKPPLIDPLSGLCACGCGQKTAIAKRTRALSGQVKGTPVRFLPGHALPHPVRPLADRFWERVDRRASLCACWVWRGLRNQRGYGTLQARPLQARPKRPHLAHRISWELAHGPVAAGLSVLHKCDNPACVRPSHLFVGDAAANARDMRAKGRSCVGDRASRRRHPERYPVGEQAYQARLTADLVRTIRREYQAGGIMQQTLATRYGVNASTIRSVLTRKSWKHVE